MKKIILLLVLASPLFSLSACGHHQTTNVKHATTVSSKKAHKHPVKKSIVNPKPNLHKKYKGFKLTTIPTQFRGTWYRSDEFSKTARPLTITSHTIDHSVVYQKTDPNLKLDHNSEKQNKEYAGNASMISVENHNGASWLKVRGFLDTVDIIYITGNFKGHTCLYLAYPAGDIHGAIFKDKSTAIKYRKYDFSKVNSQS